MNIGPYCAEKAPPVMPGAGRYLCTREDGHQGMHVAENHDRVVDTWPQRAEVERP